MSDKNVTELVEHGLPDNDSMGMRRCVCGAEFIMWGYYITMHRKSARACPECGRKLYFTQTISVYEVEGS